MNALSRPLFSAPPEMVEGSGITSMAMGGEQGMPMGEEQAARDIGGMIAGQLAAGVDQTEQNIDAVAEDDMVGLMNAFSGKNASEEEYREVLAEVVGPGDAAKTPPSVLALVQPTLAIMEMTEGIGALEGNMGGMGDISAMGGDMALMGGMGGGIGDMLSQGLPQGLPMPMGDETVAVQEEIVGRMPPVEGMQRGGVVSIPAGKKSLPFDPNNPLVQRMAGGREVTSLAERVSEIGSILPEFPGRTERTTTDNLTSLLDILAAGAAGYLSGGVRGLTGNVAQVLPELRKQKREQDRQEELAQYQRDLNIGKLAYGTYTDEQKATKLAADNLARTREGIKPEKISSTQFERMLALGVEKGTYTPEQADKMRSAYLEKELTPKTTREGFELARQKTVQETARLKNFGEEQKRYGDINLKNATKLSEAVQERVDISQLTGLISELKNLSKSGAGRETTVKLASVLTAGARILGLEETAVRGLLSSTGMNLSEDLALVDVERALGNQLALMYTSNFPGNLNQAEVDISANSAYAGLAGTQQGANVLNMLMRKKTERARERQKLYFKTRKEHYAAAAGMNKAANERALFEKWNEVDAAYTESYQNDTSVMDYIKENVPAYRSGYGAVSNQETGLLLDPKYTPKEQVQLVTNSFQSNPQLVQDARTLTKLDPETNELLSYPGDESVKGSRNNLINAILNPMIPQLLPEDRYSVEDIEGQKAGFANLNEQDQNAVKAFMLRGDVVQAFSDLFGDGYKKVLEEFFLEQ